MAAKKKTSKTKPVNKKPVAKNAKKAAAQAKADSVSNPSINGVDLSVGKVAGGGTSKNGIVTQVILSQLRVEKGFNPRTKPGEIDNLAKSIKAEGVLASLVVRPCKGHPGKLEVIAGERRFRAMKLIDWTGTIPVTIRTDLSDNTRAKAVALAENSVDGRSNLNPIEVGKVVQALTKKGWDVSKIAKEACMHPQSVRRSLKLMETPKDVQDKVASGEFAMTAGLELARLDSDKRSAVAKELKANSTAADIRAIRVVEKEAKEAAKAAKGQKTGVTTKGKPEKRTITTWRPSREKQSTLQELCYALVEDFPLAKDKDTRDYYELRGMCAMILWDRGDVKSLDLPAHDSKGDADLKALKSLNKKIAQEAAKFVPEPEPEPEAKSEKELATA